MRAVMLLPITLLAVLLDLAIAMPTSEKSTLETRKETKVLAPTTVGLYLCTDADWKGECEDLKRGPGLCINLPEKFAGKVSSAGPDSEVSGCTLFEKENCSGLELSGLMKPGESNLGASPQGGKFNDFFHSYICY